jgi:FixJ family two-component response regulator
MPIDRWPRAPRGDPPPVVCVVDDDVSFLRALQRLLRAGGFGVTTFSSAEAFLDWPDRDAIACLVLDVHLGGLNGFDVQERLVASGFRVPVLFVTARDDAPTRERARLAGAVEYLRKPFDDEALMAAVERAIGPR